MKIIDIDRLEMLFSHIHYIKRYKGRIVMMNKQAEIERINIQFSIEHKPLGLPDVKINFEDKPHFPVEELLPKIKNKIYELNDKGALSVDNASGTPG
jgi:hypothetical protein